MHLMYRSGFLQALDEGLSFISQLNSNVMNNSFSFDDFIFEHRNKAYGAYALRQSYPANMVKGIMITIPVFILFALSPKIYAWIFIKPVIHEHWAIIDLSSDPILEPIKKPKQVFPNEKKSNSKSKPQVQYTAVKVIEDHHLMDEQVPPTLRELIQNMISTENKAGDTDGEDPVTPGEGFKAESTGNANASEGLDNNTIYTFTDEMPSFPNGQQAMLDYLRHNIHYPPMAQDNNIEGKVTVSFIINKTGDIQSVHVLQGIGGGCDEEAVRVISKMPRWIPGKNHGRAVQVTYTLPIVFKLTR